jgi:hypothetical protein
LFEKTKGVQSGGYFDLEKKKALREVLHPAGRETVSVTYV